MNSLSHLYGKGVFTTVAVVGGGLFLWEKHWRRLLDNAGRSGIALCEGAEKDVLRRIGAELERQGVIDGRVRVSVCDESQSSIWPGSGGGTEITVIAAVRRDIPKDLAVTMSPYIVNSCSPLAGIKSCNYLEKIMTLDAARRGGFDECVCINERGHVTSAAMANIFWRVGGHYFTPGLQTGCLSGTTREHILESLACDEAEADASVLGKADAIYLTSAGIGVRSVRVFGGVTYDMSEAEICRILPF